MIVVFVLLPISFMFLFAFIRVAAFVTLLNLYLSKDIYKSEDVMLLQDFSSGFCVSYCSALLKKKRIK